MLSEKQNSSHIVADRLESITPRRIVINTKPNAKRLE